LNRLCEVSNSGAAISPSIGYPATGKASDNGGLSTPLAIAIDGSGNVWIANQQAAGAGTIGSLTEFSSSGTAKSGSSGFADSEPRAAFYGIAIDVLGNVWASNYSYGSLAEYNPNSGFLSPAATGDYGGGLSNPVGIAIDGSGNVWAANSYNSSLSKFSGGAPLSPTGAYGGYVGGGLNNPNGIAIDSAGNVWIANANNNNSVSQFTNGGVGVTPNPAYTGSGTIYAPINVAVDGSGDVWVTNSNGSLTEMIGAAGPVVTPVVANLVSPYGTAAVNRP